MDIQWSWSITAYNLVGKSLDEILDLCEESGVGGIEGAPPLFETMSLSELKDFGTSFEERGLMIDTFHLPFSSDDDPASFYETRRRRAVARLEDWMERVSYLGVSRVILHPTTTRFDVGVEGVDTYLEALEASLKKLLPVAEELGMAIAVENMLPGEGSRFGSKVEHFKMIFDRFDVPHLGLCLDTGHALVALRESAGDFLQEFPDKLMAFHLQDNPGDRDLHLAPGRGRCNWDEIFQMMGEVGYTGSACIEAPPFGFGPDYSPADWKKMIAETENLVRTVNSCF